MPLPNKLTRLRLFLIRNYLQTQPQNVSKNVKSYTRIAL